MASATVIAKPKSKGEAPERRWFWPGSRLGRLIVALNLLGLAVLIGGALVLNELRQGLINTEIESLTTEGRFIANVIEQAATTGDPAPALDAERARETLQLLFIQGSQRARVFGSDGQVIADTYVLNDRIDVQPLPPIRKPGQIGLHWNPFARDPAAAAAEARNALQKEIRDSLAGATVSRLRPTVSGGRVVSVSIPIQNVQDVLGVLTLESGDVDKVVANQRMALLPFIIIAILVSLSSSFLLSRVIAVPVLRLARAADRVTAQRARAISLPDIAKRDDELGDLTRSLETMTSTLSERMDAIERFAADVAHEIRNPLTSIRSAVETLELVGDPAPRERLTAILKQDVGRLDRLITDISNASRLDAELSREEPRPIDLGKLLADISSLYDEDAKPGAPPVRFAAMEGETPVVVRAREGPLSQVFRNLIDNARSFTAIGGPDADVRVSVKRLARQAHVVVEDDGPGLPAENLETVFERFYTSRPAGAAFGGHSGLGLSIARQIVEAHGGRIHAENRTEADGRIAGARFVVSLPEIGA